jgi:predicted ATPase
LKPILLAAPVLVGREYELEQLHSLLDLAIKGKGNTVFVSGEAGVGKTRLVSEFLSSAKKQEVTILTGWCLSNAAVPYFPFFEAFRRYFSLKPEKKELDTKNLFMGPLQSEKLGNPQIVTPQIWRDQTFTVVASTLISISKENPVILFIDDLHWADSASCALLHYLANIIKSEKILNIATYRTEQLTDDKSGKPTPLRETLRLLRRQDLIKELDILNLNETAVSKLARNMLGSDLQQEFISKLNQESQGNPLFIVESIRMLNESKSLAKQQNKWRLTNPTIGIPPKIKDIILQRLDSLLNTQRNTLEAAAVIGQEFDSTLLSSVLEREPIEIINILDTIARETSLVKCTGEVYSFDHSRTRETVYEEISSALRRGYHAKIAQKLEIINKKEMNSLSNIAYHIPKQVTKAKQYNMH